MHEWLETEESGILVAQSSQRHLEIDCSRPANTLESAREDLLHLMNGCSIRRFQVFASQLLESVASKKKAKLVSIWRADGFSGFILVELQENVSTRACLSPNKSTSSVCRVCTQQQCHDLCILSCANWSFRPAHAEGSKASHKSARLERR